MEYLMKGSSKAIIEIKKAAGFKSSLKEFSLILLPYRIALKHFLKHHQAFIRLCNASKRILIDRGNVIFAYYSK